MFYKRYVDDTYIKRKHNETYTLFDALNSYHPNIKFITKEKNKNKTQAFVKESMHPVH